MNVAIGADHAGWELKSAIIAWLQGKQIPFVDVGALSLDPDDDYPDFAGAVARRVAGGESDLGIVICGTGVGSCIAANKVPGVKAALCHDVPSARWSRLHNDANVLCLGGWVLGKGLAAEIVETWLSTPFSGDDRHRRRLGKVAGLERREGG